MRINKNLVKPFVSSAYELDKKTDKNVYVEYVDIRDLAHALVWLLLIVVVGFIVGASLALGVSRIGYVIDKNNRNQHQCDVLAGKQPHYMHVDQNLNNINWCYMVSTGKQYQL